jgi:hypothetical protein
VWPAKEKSYGSVWIIFRKISLFAYTEFPCRFYFRRKWGTFAISVYDYFVSVSFPQNAAFVSVFCSPFPFSSETNGKFPFRFQPYMAVHIHCGDAGYLLVDGTRDRRGWYCWQNKKNAEYLLAGYGHTNSSCRLCKLGKGHKVL